MGKRYNKNEIYDNRFYKIPKAFFKVDKYKKLSVNAKVIYGFLDDRRELSLKNNWIDKDGYIYLIFTREEVAEMLCLSYKTAIKAFKELKKYELIEEVRQGINKPNLIYVCHLDLENADITWMCKNYTSRDVNITGQDMYKLQGNDTDVKDTDFSDTDFINGAVKRTVNFPRSFPLVINRYISTYEKLIGEKHPNISENNKAEIFSRIESFLGNNDLVWTDITLTDWQEMIDRHFEVDYGKQIDYKAYHFFTEGVLQHRYEEVLF